MLSEKLSKISSEIEHVFIFLTRYLPNNLDEPRIIVDDLNFLILVKMLVDCSLWRKKNIDLLSRNSTFSLECF